MNYEERWIIRNISRFNTEAYTLKEFNIKIKFIGEYRSKLTTPIGKEVKERVIDT